MKYTRFAVFLAVFAAHGLAIMCLAFTLTAKAPSAEEPPKYIELEDFQYATAPSGGNGDPPPLAPSEPVQSEPVVTEPQPASTSDFAEPVEEKISGPSTVTSQANGVEGGVIGGTGTGNGGLNDSEYLPLQKISEMPVIAEKSVREKLIYPEMARRAGIVGSVFLELFVDATGTIRKISVLKENPAGYGFAAAAIGSFDGITCVPAKVDGQAVAVRFRYPIRFTLN
jgi:protein TonB